MESYIAMARSKGEAATWTGVSGNSTTQLKIFGTDTGGRGREMVEYKAENWQSLDSGNRVALVECPLFGRDSAVNLYLSSAKYLLKIVRLLFLQ